MEEGFKACPYCAEPIREAATICRYCNRDVRVAARPVEPEAPNVLGLEPTRSPVIGAARPTPPVAAKSSWKAIRWGLSLFGILLFSLWAYIHSRTSDVHRTTLLTARPASGKLLTGNLEVDAGHIRWVSFTVPPNATNVQVNGEFHAFGGQGNDIWVVIADTFDFENWKNNHATRLFYNSGKVTNGEIAVQGLPPGAYVLAFDNRFSAFTRKEVTGEITLTYLVP